MIPHSEDLILIRKSTDPHGYMGNMCGFWEGRPLNLLIDGETWSCAESYFQASRFSDPEIRRKIQKENGYNSKKVAKQFQDEMVIKPTSFKDFFLMGLVIMKKFNSHPHIKEELNSTKGIIIEDVSLRTEGNSLFWGAARVNNHWIGYNALGKLLMLYRDHRPMVDGILEYKVDFSD